MKVEIFYRQLNYEVYTESVSYDVRNQIVIICLQRGKVHLKFDLVDHTLKDINIHVKKYTRKNQKF